MPTITVQLNSAIRPTFRVMQIAGMFDIPIHERLQHNLTAEVPGLEESWSIGAIVGPSGSGKSTLAKAAFNGALYDPQLWSTDAAIIDCFGPDTPIKQLIRVLTAVGLGSVPTWLKPYHALSTGERCRADLARALIEVRKFSTRRRGGVENSDSASLRVSAPPRETNLLVFDEFTSSLDRTIAQTTSAALSRFIRKVNQFPGQPNFRFVAVTCHDDILPWLQPDWVLNLGHGNPRLTRGRLHQPTLQLPVRKVPQSTWTHFAAYHYLTTGLARSATCYAAFAPVGWAVPTTDRPIAFCAAAPSLGWQKTKRITRLVTLPEFQGLGIAGRLLAIVATHEASKGNHVTITASHPAILAHCANSPRWQFTGHKPTGSTTQIFRGRPITCSIGRPVASFEFISSSVPTPTRCLSERLTPTRTRTSKPLTREPK